MDAETRTALLALWREIPETRPDGLGYDSIAHPQRFYIVHSNPNELPMDNPIMRPWQAWLTDAEASDLACGSIERWLLARSSALVVAHRDARPGWHCDTAHGDPAQWIDRDGCVFHNSKLSALIAAANAVAARTT